MNDFALIAIKQWEKLSKKEKWHRKSWLEGYMHGYIDAAEK